MSALPDNIHILNTGGKLMIIGSDFDGVIADTFSLTEKGVSLEAILSGDIDVRLIPPMPAYHSRITGFTVALGSIFARPFRTA